MHINIHFDTPSFFTITHKKINYAVRKKRKNIEEMYERFN